MKFEIHITGEESILDEFDKLNIKNIRVALLTPKLENYRVECMSSFVLEAKNYTACKEHVDCIIAKLKSKIFRVKIECPYYPYMVDHAIYIESHFLHKPGSIHPVSENMKSGKRIGTDRCYQREYFPMFSVKWKNAEVELCLYDDYVREDFDWFALYNK